MSTAPISTFPVLVTTNSVPLPKDILALNNALAFHLSALEGVKNLVVATSNTTGHKNAIDVCFPILVSLSPSCLTDSVADLFQQSSIDGILSQMLLFPDAPWSVPDSNLPVVWSLDLRDVLIATLSLKRLWLSLQQLGISLGSLAPEQVIDEGELSDNPHANFSQQDEPIDPMETELVERSVTIHNADDMVGPTDKGKQWKHTPTLEPATNKEEMALVDQELQKELAGQKASAEQGLILQNPKVSFPFSPTKPFLLTPFYSVAAALLPISSVHATLPANIHISAAKHVGIKNWLLVYGYWVKVDQEVQ